VSTRAVLHRATGEESRLGLAYLIFIGTAVLWAGFEANLLAENEPPFLMRLSMAALLFAAFNAISINTEGNSKVRLGVSAVVFVTSVVLWVLFEVKLLGQGEPALVVRISLMALLYEGFNGISINKAD
jgi:hypothetical protein